MVRIANFNGTIWNHCLHPLDKHNIKSATFKSQVHHPCNFYENQKKIRNHQSIATCFPTCQDFGSLRSLRYPSVSPGLNFLATPADQLEVFWISPATPTLPVPQVPQVPVPASWGKGTEARTIQDPTR